MKKILASATALAILASAPAFADSTSSRSEKTPVVIKVDKDATPVGNVIAEVLSPFVTSGTHGRLWSVNDLKGKDVYGIEGESIGSVSDVLIEQGGIAAVVIDVGGFLGIGSKSVALDMSTLQVGPETSQADADRTAQVVADLKAVKDGGPDAALKRHDASDEKNMIGKDGLPDRIVLNVTRDQLKTAPEFKNN